MTKGMAGEHDFSGALCSAPQMPCSKHEFIENSFARLRNELVQKSLMEKKTQILQRQLEESEKAMKLMHEQMEILQETVRRQERLLEENADALQDHKALSECQELRLKMCLERRLREFLDQWLNQMESQRERRVRLVDVGVQAGVEPDLAQGQKQPKSWWRLVLCFAPLVVCGLLHALWSTVELVHNSTPPF